jgi:hypothetical protein
MFGIEILDVAIGLVFVYVVRRHAVVPDVCWADAVPGR